MTGDDIPTQSGDLNNIELESDGDDYIDVDAMRQFIMRRDELDLQRAWEGIDHDRPERLELSQESMSEREPFFRQE